MKLEVDGVKGRPEGLEPEDMELPDIKNKKGEQVSLDALHMEGDVKRFKALLGGDERPMAGVHTRKFTPKMNFEHESLKCGPKGLRKDISKRPQGMEERMEAESRKGGRPDPPSLADAILSGMGAGEKNQEPVAWPVQSSDAPHHISNNQGTEKIVQKLCERILVSKRDLHGNQEVRITLKESAIPETEVRIRLEGHTLKVEFVTESRVSGELLENNLDTLKERLGQRVTENVVVTVKGHDEFNGQGQDGRSRQRRFVYDEVEG